jgi:hypothetical protein
MAEFSSINSGGAGVTSELKLYWWLCILIIDIHDVVLVVEYTSQRVLLHA